MVYVVSKEKLGRNLPLLEFQVKEKHECSTLPHKRTLPFPSIALPRDRSANRFQGHQRRRTVDLKRRGRHGSLPPSRWCLSLSGWGREAV